MKLLAGLAVACCLGAPLLVGTLGALSLGAVFGLVAGLVALAVLCLLAVRKLHSQRC